MKVTQMKKTQMKNALSILTVGLVALSLPLSASAQKTQGAMIEDGNFGPVVKTSTITETKIVNLQGEVLGRIQDLILDLPKGRIVAVLVSFDQTLRLGGKTVALPPMALTSATANNTYTVNMSIEDFKNAPAFDSAKSKWVESTQPVQLAAAYRYFGQQPYFTFPGEAGKSTVPGSEFVHLGSTDSMTDLINMPVDNLKGENLGSLQTIVLDISSGTILKTYIHAKAPSSMLKFSTIIQATEFTFNPKHDKLLLDDTKVEYADEPRVIFQAGSAGQSVSHREQDEHTDVKLGLQQGTNSADINKTAQIYKAIQDAKLDAKEQVEVATFGGRVTLQGPVDSQATKDQISAIAIAAVKGAAINNLLVVVAPAKQASL